MQAATRKGHTSLVNFLLLENVGLQQQKEVSPGQSIQVWGLVPRSWLCKCPGMRCFTRQGFFLGNTGLFCFAFLILIVRNKIQRVNFRKPLKLLHKTNSLCLRSVCCSKSQVSRGAPTLVAISPAWEMPPPRLLWLWRKWIISPSLNDLVVFQSQSFITD